MPPISWGTAERIATLTALQARLVRSLALALWHGKNRVVPGIWVWDGWLS